MSHPICPPSQSPVRAGVWAHEDSAGLEIIERGVEGHVAMVVEGRRPETERAEVSPRVGDCGEGATVAGHDCRNELLACLVEEGRLEGGSSRVVEHRFLDRAIGVRRRNRSEGSFPSHENAVVEVDGLVECYVAEVVDRWTGIVAIEANRLPVERGSGRIEVVRRELPSPEKRP